MTRKRGGWPLFGAFVRDFIAFARWRSLTAALLALLGAIVEMAGLTLVAPVVAIVAGSGGGWPAQAAERVFAVFGVESDFGRVSLLIGAFCGLIVLRSAIIWLRDSVLAALQIGFAEAQRARIARALAAASWSRVSGLRHSRAIHALGQDVARIGQAANMLIQTSVAVIMLSAQGAVALSLAPALAGASLVLFAAGALVLAIFLRGAHRMGAEVTNLNLKLSDAAGRFLGGLKLAASQNLQGAFVERFEGDLSLLRSQQAQFLRRQSAARQAVAALTFIAGAAATLLAFGWLATPLPVLAALILVLSRMGGPATQIQQASQQLAYALPAYDHVVTLESDLAGPAEPQAATASPIDPAGKISFDKVSFAHPARDEAGEAAAGVEALSFSLVPGEMLGLTGPSGAGKSTLADLLVGLIAPQGGEIRIGKNALTPANAGGWREHVAYVAQDPYLFNATVRENLAWAPPLASDAQMMAALKAAGAAEVMDRLPAGLDTVVGERGALLSGGERQRIALARALLRDARLLVLDEATSAVDIATERQILESLRKLDPAPAILMIAHRAESLAFCDRVLTLRDGRLVSPVVGASDRR